jgi:hypothetical protein
VVNVVSKSARDTQGLLTSVAGGSFDPMGMVGARYGGQQGEHTYYRVYAKGTIHGETVSTNGAGLNDDWNSLLTGFRVDSEIGPESVLSVLGGMTVPAHAFLGEKYLDNRGGQKKAYQDSRGGWRPGVVRTGKGRTTLGAARRQAVLARAMEELRTGSFLRDDPGAGADAFAESGGRV